MEVQKEIKKPVGKGKLILIGLGVAGLGTLAFFTYKKLSGKEEAVEIPNEESNYSIPETQESKPTVIVNNGFPIKRGSKGDRVKEIQKFLVTKGLLSEKDVIGEFGPKTQGALSKLGLPIVLDESAYNAIINSSGPKENLPSPPIDAKTFALGLINAARGKNYSAAVKILSNIKNTADYSAVSEKFKTYYLNTVRQTLVNGMLSTFTSPTQKEELKTLFESMGLKYNAGKYSLSGLSGRGLITKQPTTVFDHALCGIKVPRNTVLGIEAGKKGKFTQFTNNGKYFLVPTTNINYI